MTDVTHYKTKLEEERDTLQIELESLGVQNKQESADWIPTPTDVTAPSTDQNEVADRSEDWQERRGTLDQLETRFNNVVRALDKITNNTYGRCEVCNSDIETVRLDANPAARTCLTHLAEEVTLPL